MKIVHLLLLISLGSLGSLSVGCGKKDPGAEESAGSSGGDSGKPGDSGDSGNPDDPNNPGGETPGPKNPESVAAFNEIAKVLTSPRCINCHPSGDRPTQGDKMQPHQPPVFRGAGGKGAVGMRCTTCHGAQNYAFVEGGSIPGVDNWHLAPESMAWQGKSLHEICKQIKDPARNGGKSLAQIIEHHEKDPAVLWAWNPGADRAPAPGTHEEFVKWTRKWVETGAHCPDP